MISDAQTNFLYLADTLPVKYPTFFDRFQKILIDNNIAFALLPQTRDVWAVDYMPVQIRSDRFVQFVYRPSYLTKQDLHTISDVDTICSEIGIHAHKSNIHLDGGNIVRSANSAFLTDRIFSENPQYGRKKLIIELQELLQADRIYLIPEQPGDFTGHADGMVRFVNEAKIIINDYTREKSSFRRSFEIAIHNTGLEYEIIPYNVYENTCDEQANGDYINYLEIGDKLIIPIFNLPTDEDAIRVIESCFPDKKIIAIESNEIANDGGVLNCISWNISINEK